MFADKSDEELIQHSLNLWANYLETGDVTLSQRDAVNMGKPDLINSLTLEQQSLVLRLRQLSLKHLNKPKG